MDTREEGLAKDEEARWRSEDTGLAGEGIEWVDTHVHILPPRRMRGLIRWVKRFMPGYPLSEEITPEEIVAGLRRSGIRRFFSLVFPLWEEETEELNRFNRDLCAELEGAVPFGSLHIDTPDKGKETTRCIEEYGFLGMKLHPYAQGFPAFSEEMRPMFEVLDHHRRPLLVHTGFDAFYGRNMDLERMEEVLRRYPGMQVVAVHSFFPRFRLAHTLLGRYENLWLDMTNAVSCMRLYRDLQGGEASFPSPESGLEVEELRENEGYFELLMRDFPDRVMYGTDFPVGFGSHPALLEDLRCLGLGREAERGLLQGAAENLLSRCGYTPS